MDAFFAAVEQRDFPEYRDKPLIVGGKPDSRGVVATCSYEARKYGVHSAMPSSHAYRLCPDAIFVKPRFESYREASNIIRSIFSQHTDLVEPLSLDEAYLDVSEVNTHEGSATLIAKQIKTQILNQTELTSSAGISYNKFLAKIASDMDKPDGIYLIKPAQGPAFIEKLSIRKFHGVGCATEAKMKNLGILTGKDLKQFSLELLQQHFGKAGSYYYNIARGIDHRPVNTHRPRKSCGVETTFQQDIKNIDRIIFELQILLKKALRKVSEKHLIAYTVTVKIKYHDFEQITRSRTLNSPISANTLDKTLFDELLKSTDIGMRQVRLLGVTLSAFEERANSQAFKQLDLFD
jgi:DNA polymerase-4